MRTDSLWSNVVFDKKVISHSNIKRLQLKGVFSFIFLLQLRWPVELKFSQICYFMHMLGYAKWEYWSLTITKPCPVPLSQANSCDMKNLLCIHWVKNFFHHLLDFTLGFQTIRQSLKERISKGKLMIKYLKSIGLFISFAFNQLFIFDCKTASAGGKRSHGRSLGNTHLWLLI